MLTKLEAINEILASIGEEPVSSLESGLADAEAAEDMLDRWSKQVQAMGWQSNTEWYEASPDINGEILIADTVLRIDSVRGSKYIDVAVRRHNGQRKLYDVTDRSYTFTSKLWVEVVYLLDFEDLTYELQNYITAKAAQAYQTSVLSSVTMDQFVTRDVMEAWSQLLDSEGEAEDLNMLRSNSHAYTASYRKNPRGLII